MNRHIRCALSFAGMLFLAIHFAGAQSAQISHHISNSDIQCFAQDSRGYIWIGTARGLNRYNGAYYSAFYAGNSEFDLHSNNILALTQDTDGRLWFGTECGIGYYRDGRFHQYSNTVYNPTSQVLELNADTVVGVGLNGFISFHKDDINTPTGRFFDNGTSEVNQAVVSCEEEIWFPRQSGDSTFICVLNGQLQRVKEFYIGHNIQIAGLAAHPAHSIWVATEDDGVHCFDSREHAPVPTPDPLASLVKGKHVFFLLPYHDQELLVGISGQGMFSYDITDGSVTQVIPEQRLNASEYICFVDRDSNIWLSDKQSEVRFYAERRPYTHLSPGENPLLAGRIARLAFDPEGWLWMRAGERLCSIDPATGEVGWISPLPNTAKRFIIGRNGLLSGLSSDGRSLEQYRLSGGKATLMRTIPLEREGLSIGEDVAGQLWVALPRQLALVSEDGNVSYLPGPEGVPFTMTLSDPASRRVFLFTVKDGLYEISPDRSLRRIGARRLANTDVVVADRDSTLWCGTYNDGLIHYDERNGTLEQFDSSSGMVASNVRSMLEDEDGNIWFSTSEHITRYNPLNGTFSTLRDDHFSNGSYYDLVSAAKGPDGRLYFGGTGGITVIDPSRPLPQARKRELAFEYISAGGEQLPDNVPEIRLNWQERDLELRFSSLDFESGSQLNYSYRLEGFEREWKYSSNDVLVSYSQLPAGHYTFVARVRNEDGQWSPEELRLPVTIHPTPWASWWAKLLYVILFLGLGWLAMRVIFRIKMQENQIALAAQRSELKQQQIDFVTNISHEFRTPLSMIYGPVKELSKRPLDAQERVLVDAIARNAERLRGLSEQILSTQGGRQESETLRIRQNDLTSVVRSMMDNFSYAASQKGQEIRLEAPDSLIVWFDTEKVSKILGNLVSNAVKYTPDGGHIRISLQDLDGNRARIEVADDGIGIPEDKRERIFERFDRLGAENSGVIGSGIGLNYARSLARLHMGRLGFKPNVGGGSIFTLEIPISHDAFPDADIDETKYRPPVETPVTENEGDKLGTLLIAEDTDEIRYFLHDLFAPSYRVITASDGLDAEENLKLALPDLVLSDVMMPRKNGYSLCKDIKENPDWSHIPVILLTAKSDARSHIEGMEQGADAYVPKPFDPDVLKASVESLIRNRRLLQQRVLNLTSTTLKEADKAEDVHLSAGDKALLKRIHAWMDAHLDDETVGVQEMAGEAGMSYSSLYAKMKALTGKTPQAFMSHYRMNIALELLQGGDLNVSEVAYRVGSSSPSTFSREFKKHFGFPPSQVNGAGSAN